jgi:glycosyltransferase involved in cell wall biosynthesis
MEITIIAADLSINSIARSYTLGMALSRRYKVKIIGFRSGKKIWPPADTGEFNYIDVQLKPMPFAISQLNKLLKELTGNVIYAHKPLSSSFGVALLKKLSYNVPVILDIEDWDLGFRLQDSKNKSIYKRTKKILEKTKNTASLLVSNPFSQIQSSVWLFEKLIPFADHITVSNRFLQRKFGGTIVPHGRNMSFFDPHKYRGDKIREKEGLKASFKVSFIGTPRGHKGLEVLMDAVSKVREKNITLFIVSLKKSTYADNLRRKCIEKLGADRVEFLYTNKFQSIPKYLAVADLIVIPSKKSSSNIGQIPVKLFDAMAMAKPIIASSVSDAPKVLEGCGWIVEPDNADELAHQIQYVFDNPLEAKKMGQRAREKCIKNYSWEAIEKILSQIFEKYK